MLDKCIPPALPALAGLIKQSVPFVHGDVRDDDILDGVFEDGCFDAVVHLAALKAVGESARDPLRYFANNVAPVQEFRDAVVA